MFAKLWDKNAARFALEAARQRAYGTIRLRKRSATVPVAPAGVPPVGLKRRRAHRIVRGFDV